MCIFELTFGVARYSFDTMISEDKLTGAEQAVLAAFRAGDTEVGVVGVAIRGDFLRGLFLGGYDKDAGYSYRGTVIVGAVINDVLNMEFCETKFPVRFRNCYFAREIKLQQLTCPELSLRDCTLIKSIDARCAKADGDVFLCGGFNVASTVSLVGAAIGGQLNCAGGNFQNEGDIALNAQNAKVNGVAFLNDGFRAVGGVVLAGAEIGGQFNCGGGNFQNKKDVAINAEDIKVVGSVFLNSGFGAEGEVSLSGAEIGGQFVCTDGNFRNEGKIALNALSIKVTSSAFLNTDDPHGEFKAVGEVVLAGAEIGGQLVCTSGIFQNKGGHALNLSGIKVAETVFLRDGFDAVGEVALFGADIGGQLYCASGSFQNEGKIALNAQSIKVANGVALTRNFSANGLVFFMGIMYLSCQIGFYG